MEEVKIKIQILTKIKNESILEPSEIDKNKNETK